MEAREYLRNILYTRKEVDDWFADKGLPLEKHDGELGYLYHSGRFKDGVDGSTSTYNFDESGARRMMMYAGRSCRINTYGDSFTECHQVSDGETWQEILAAHLCEPIRNFGVGGYAVYQAYLRMKREEIRTPAEYVILGIYDDDHYRNLNSWRRIRQGVRPQSVSTVLHVTVPHVKVNPATGEFVECENPCPTPESFYDLCNLDWVYETFKDDFVLKIMLAYANINEGNPEKSYQEIMDVARAHGITAQIDSAETLSAAAHTLYTRAAIYASIRTVEKMEELAAANGKKVLYVLSYGITSWRKPSLGSSNITRKIREGYRFDQAFVDFLQKNELPYVDLMEAHIAEFAEFKTSIEDYLKRYFIGIGHYNPLGNFFQAFAIKDKLVEMLEPKPISYQGDSLQVWCNKPGRRPTECCRFL
jgi:hypothetical protein